MGDYLAAERMDEEGNKMTAKQQGMNINTVEANINDRN